jgi:DNA-binding beta-propeller fold protein YncE
LVVSRAIAGSDSPAAPPAAQLRRPIAAAFLADGHTLCVANERRGTLSLVHVGQHRLYHESTVGQHLTDVVALPNHRHILVVDDKRHELIAVVLDGVQLTVRTRLPVGPYPASVAVLEGGRLATVASLWSRRLEVVDLTPLASGNGPVVLRTVHQIRLPFAPRLQCVLPGRSEILLADAFGGHLAVVDAAVGRLVTVHELAGHNLRGLALDTGGKHVLISHQVLNQRIPATRANIERGGLMANVVRIIPVDRLRCPGADLDACSRLLRLGKVGAGAGDPAGLAVLDTEQVAVALAGVNEVALLRLSDGSTRRIGAGRRPTAVVAQSPGQPLVILNTFDDSLSLLDARRGLVTGTISLGPQPRLSPQDRGELLFHDARLSRDGWLSCHSCHTDGHTNGLLADTLADHTYGTPKRTLTLMNTALTDPWAWNGEMKYLHDQVRQSLAETMHSPHVVAEQVDDLVSFLHTLPAPPPTEPATTDKADREQLENGRRIFEERGCVRCHIPPLTYSSAGAPDVGFADERGQRNFNPPSLRGVSQGYRFLHDNRAASLEQVFTKFRHKVGTGMSRAELADLLRFLRSL